MSKYLSRYSKNDKLCKFPVIRLVYNIPQVIHEDAAQLRQPIENSLVLCHLKTLRLYTGLFEFEHDHYLTNVARVKSTYWG